jgi:methyl-accepting chemotaxis protein
MAEQAGEQMQQTRDSTSRLVESVKLIAKDAEDQERLGIELQMHASSIQECTRKTHTQMQEQTQYSKRLVQFAKGLLTAVQVFTLPQLPKSLADAPVTAAEVSDTNAQAQQSDLHQKVS